MERPNTNEPDDSKEKPPADDLVEEIKRIIEENDPTISVEEIIRPHSMRLSSKSKTAQAPPFGNVESG